MIHLYNIQKSNDIVLRKFRRGGGGERRLFFAGFRLRDFDEALSSGGAERPVLVPTGRQLETGR